MSETLFYEAVKSMLENDQPCLVNNYLLNKYVSMNNVGSLREKVRNEVIGSKTKAVNIISRIAGFEWQWSGYICSYAINR